VDRRTPYARSPGGRERGPAHGRQAAAPQSLWRNRDFRLLISGRVVSFAGSQVQNFAMPLLVLAISGSAAEAGIVLALGNLAWLVFGPASGALADRWNRKTTMMISDLCRAVLMISIPVAWWLHGLTVAQLGAVAVLSGLFKTLFDSADAAALPNVVTPEQLPAALGHLQSATNIVRIAGSMVAGALYAVRRAVPFIADSVSYLCSAASLRFTRANFEDPPDDGKDPDPNRSLIGEIRQGISWLRGQRLVRFLVLISAADSIRYGAGYLVIITLAQRLGASPAQIGFVFTGAAAGAMAGSLAARRVHGRFGLGRIAIVTLWVEALMFPLYAYAPTVWLLAAVAAAESVFAPIYTVAMSSCRLAATPDELRGRISSAVLTLTSGAMSTGALLGGTLITSLGGRNTTLLLAAWLMLLAGLTTANKTVRHSSPAPGGAPSPRATGPGR
jgi:MFS family permease